MSKLILENFHLKNFVQPSSGWGFESCRFLTTGFTHGYSNSTTSWFETKRSLKGLKLNSLGLSAAQPGGLVNDINRRNQLTLHGSEEIMRRNKIKMNENNLLNPPVSLTPKGGCCRSQAVPFSELKGEGRQLDTLNLILENKTIQRLIHNKLILKNNRRCDKSPSEGDLGGHKKTSSQSSLEQYPNAEPSENNNKTTFSTSMTAIFAPTGISCTSTAPGRPSIILNSASTTMRHPSITFICPTTTLDQPSTTLARTSMALIGTSITFARTSMALIGASTTLARTSMALIGASTTLARSSMTLIGPSTANNHKGFASFGEFHIKSRDKTKMDKNISLRGGLQKGLENSLDMSNILSYNNRRHDKSASPWLPTAIGTGQGDLGGQKHKTQLRP